jgi:hypothetical protein
MVEMPTLQVTGTFNKQKKTIKINYKNENGKNSSNFSRGSMSCSDWGIMVLRNQKAESAMEKKTRAGLTVVHY